MSKVSAATAPSEHSSENELDWIQMRSDFAGVHVETTKQKMARKINENPLVPIGCLATLTALGFGLWNFRKGRSQMSQYMMRARILAQGFTVIALLIGVGMTYGNKEQSKK